MYIKIPIDKNGVYDLELQNKIVDKYKFIEKYIQKLKYRLCEINNATISFEENYNMKNVKITDLFKLNLGDGKYTKKKCMDIHGTYPVYSGNTVQPFDYINEYCYDGEYLTWAKDGLAGYLMYHNEKFSITNHRGILIPTEKCKNIDLQYIKLVLEPIFRDNIKGRLGLEGKNEYTTLSKDMINNIQQMIPIPIKETGDFDIDKQREISNKILRINKIKEKILKEIEMLINIEIELI